jgi:hypothetical protein
MTEESKTNAIVLNVKDRFMVLELFADRGTLTDQIIAQDIQKRVALSQEESKEIGLQATPDGLIKWKEGKDILKEFAFTDAELNYLDRQIKQKSAEGQIMRDMVETILKIQGLIKA